MRAKPKPCPPPGRNDDKFNQLVLMRELIEVMTRLTTPPPSVLPMAPGQSGTPPSAITLPGGTVQLTTPPAQLAIDTANSAVAIAHAAASLGAPPTTDAAGKTCDDTTRASVLWEETLAQMARIQQLYGLGSYPFQSQPLPAAKAGL